MDPTTHMTRPTQVRLTTLIRCIGIRQVRLVSGIILYAYVLSHLLNHALGNFSTDETADCVWLHASFWQFLTVAMVFRGASAAHDALGIWSLYERRQFRWKSIVILQHFLRLMLPILVITHVIGDQLE